MSVVFYKMLRALRFSASNAFRLNKKYCSSTCHTTRVLPDSNLSILENGVRVANEKTNSSLACISLFIEAGSRFEISCNNGITHFIERMAYKGFNGMSRCELQDFLLMSGTKLTAHTSRELQVFSGKCLTEYVPVVVGILANVITDLALCECDIECEKQNMQLELMDAENDLKQVLFDYLHQTAFQGTPLSNRVIGTSENISRFDKCFIANYMCDHYQPFKLALVGSGNFTHEELVNSAKCKFGHMVANPHCESEEGPARFTGSQIMYRNDDIPYAHVAIAFEVPGFNTADYICLMAAKNMIGSWRKSQGGYENNAPPLAQAASTDGLCDYYEAFYIPYRDIGLWGIYFVSKKMKVEDMLYNVQNNWMHICITLQHYEAERAANALKLEYARRYDGAIRSCYDLGFQVMYCCERHKFSDFSYDVKSVHNSTAVKTALEKWIYDRCPAVAAVGPTESLPDYTRIRAGQYWLRL